MAGCLGEWGLRGRCGRVNSSIEKRKRLMERTRVWVGLSLGLGITFEGRVRVGSDGSAVIGRGRVWGRGKVGPGW